MTEMLVQQVRQETEKLLATYQLERLPEERQQKLEERIQSLRCAQTTDEAARLKTKAIDLVFIHCLMHGKKYSPEFLEKQAAKNESLAKWKYDQGKDDEAEKARKRAEKYKKEAEKLRKKAPR